MAPAKGLLLIDVDGPLNPFAAKPNARPPGYSTYRRTAVGGWYSGRDVRRYKGLRVWLNPQHGAALLALAEATGLELTWCTTWLHEANTRIGPAIGLPRLPVIEFPAADLAPDGPDAHRWTRDGAWKWTSVAEYAAGRPLAWLDDDLDDPQFARARRRFDLDRAGIPTLLSHVDPRTGIQATHVEQIRTWAADQPGLPR